MIRLSGVEVLFGAVCALALDRLEIADGERLGITGANGSGKSTLLRVLAGLQQPTTGTVEGLPTPGRVVLLHQRPYLLRGTARDNVVYALRIHGRPAAEADDLLGLLGAAHVADRTAADLSGGERRRVALARALAVRPDVLLLDEPLAALDGQGRDDVLRVTAAFTGTLVVAAPAVDGVAVDRVVTLATPRSGERAGGEGNGE